MNSRSQAHTFDSSNPSILPPRVVHDSSDHDLIGASCDPRQQSIDEDDTFWSTYVSEASKYDAELLASWNENLSSLLLFAALFSAINTAFIIECQKGLQPDPVETTNQLLLRILNGLNNHSEGPPDEVLDSSWSAKTSALWLNAIFFTSLSFSLIASFGAILGKEMLSQYKTSGVLNSIAEQGQIRQQKFDGLRKFRFRFLMHALPALLQISLALFLIGLVDFLWQMNVNVAMVMFIPVVCGFIAYSISLGIALRYSHSPYQTSVSIAIKLLISSVQNFSSSVGTYTPGAKSRIPPAQTSVVTGHSQMPTHRPNQFIGGVQIKKGLETLLQQCRGLKSALSRSSVRRAIKSSRNSLLQERRKKDVVQAGCVAWLIERAGNSRVQWQALNAIPLIPADVLLPFFGKQGILHRCIFLYQSNLHRHPGQVKYVPDETQTKTAILAGTAIFHVLKSRIEDDNTHGQSLWIDGDPDVFDIVENPDRIDELNFLLLTVIHCVQSQFIVTEWDVDLLLRLLQRCSSSKTPNLGSNLPITINTADLHSPVPATAALTPLVQHQELSFHSSFSVQDLASVTLLLDSVLYCASRGNGNSPNHTILLSCSNQFEQILDTLPKILESRKSIMLASHAAIVVSAIQWYKAANGQAFEGLFFHGVTRKMIRSAWFAVDKSAQFHDNIVLAFKLVGDNPSPATTKIYLSLMRLVECFHHTSMSVTWKNSPEWKMWWPKALLIIPGIFRVFDQLVDDRNRQDATKSALRVIAQIIPDDWMKGLKDPGHPVQLEDLRSAKRLRCIDPHHEEHGKSVISLMAYFLKTAALQDCRTTRDAAAEVLGWMITLYLQEDRPGIDSVISDPNGMYHQLTSVPSFLLSVLQDNKTDEILRCFVQDQFDCLLELPATPSGSVYEVQLQAFVISIAGFPHFPSSPTIVNTVRRFLNKIADVHHESIWPDSFITAGIVEYSISPSVTNLQVLKLVEDDIKLFGNDDIRLLWMGTALVISWKLFVKDAQGVIAEHSVVFHSDAILLVLDCFDRAIKTGNHVFFSLFNDFLDSAQVFGKVPDQLRAQVEAARAGLWSALNGDWDWLVIQRHGQENPPA